MTIAKSTAPERSAIAKEILQEEEPDCHMYISRLRFTAFLGAGLIVIPTSIYYAASEVARLF
ncbi:MAG: hypothetical protein V4681_02930 [Patescibacteria group bacterium]